MYISFYKSIIAQVSTVWPDHFQIARATPGFHKLQAAIYKKSTDAVDRPSNKAKVKVAAIASISTTINSLPKVLITVKVSSLLRARR